MKAWEEICTRRGAGAIAVDITIGDSRVITVSYRGDQPTAGADAVRLILAAPAMREALAGLLDAIKRGVYFEDGGLDGACEKARAALALADGERCRDCAGLPALSILTDPGQPHRVSDHGGKR